jgi:hypothetical protein
VTPEGTDLEFGVGDLGDDESPLPIPDPHALITQLDFEMSFVDIGAAMGGDMDSPSVVLRCCHCEGVLLVLTRGRDSHVLGLGRARLVGADRARLTTRSA